LPLPFFLVGKMIDCIPFFRDLDLLEIRLHTLAPQVEQFVVLESPLALSNKPKPLFFYENRERFKDFNIRHLVYEPHDSATPWERAWNQLRFMIKNLDVPKDCMVLISDGDEIPNLDVWNGGEGVFVMDRFYWRLNGFSGRSNWLGTDAILKSTLDENDIKEIRWHRKENKHLWGKNIYRNGGWHFSCLGDIEDVIYKYESNGHSELYTRRVLAQVRKNYANRNHPLDFVRFRRKTPTNIITQMPSGPKWLLENKERYKNLFYEE